ncbi:MAG: NifU family protein [Chloroflexi bacterium]|nr:NifU family protein [Chloroflexota bacterium]
MDVPPRLQQVCDDLREAAGAQRAYVIDVDERPSGGLLGTVVFGIRDATSPALLARQQAQELLGAAAKQPIGAEVFTEPLDEVEYLFDRYLRAYIASHDGVVTPVRIDESARRLWVHFDGGCSGCPASIATLKHGIERTLKKHLPWIERVEAVNEAAEPDFGIKLDLSASLKAGVSSEEK